MQATICSADNKTMDSCDLAHILAILLLVIYYFYRVCNFLQNSRTLANPRRRVINACSLEEPREWRATNGTTTSSRPKNYNVLEANQLTDPCLYICCWCTVYRRPASHPTVLAHQHAFCLTRNIVIPGSVRQSFIELLKNSITFKILSSSKTLYYIDLIYVIDIILIHHFIFFRMGVAANLPHKPALAILRRSTIVFFGLGGALPALPRTGSCYDFFASKNHVGRKPNSPPYVALSPLTPIYRRLKRLKEAWSRIVGRQTLKW